MGSEFILNSPVVEIRHEDGNQVQEGDLEKYKALGVLDTVIIQGDDDEDVEQQFMDALELKTSDTLYVNEPGEERKLNGQKS